MLVSRHVDWLSVTFGKDFHAWDMFPAFDWKFSGKGNHGYQAKYECLELGAWCEEAAKNSEQGNHLVLPGSAIDRLRQSSGVLDDRLMHHLSSFDGRASRIDLCINMHGCLMTPQAVNAAREAKQAVFAARQSRMVLGVNGDIKGDTLYIGSRLSDRFMRIYDKGAEQQIVDREAWIRLELELKNLAAVNAQRACDSNPVKAVVSAHMSAFMTWDNPEYHEALGGLTCDIRPVKQPTRKTVAWLLGPVAIAMAREMKMDDELAAKFWFAVQEARRKLDDAQLDKP